MNAQTDQQFLSLKDVTHTTDGGSPDARFIPLEKEHRTAVDTVAAAHHLNRRPQTLRGWACRPGTGPLEAIRVNGRLAWPVAELKRVLGVAQ